MEENWDTISAGDTIDDLDDKLEEIDIRNKPKLDFFSKSKYFDKIFPGVKIQKPGYDLYGTATTMSVLIFIYVFLFFKQFTVNPDIFEFVNGQSSIFKGDQAVTLFILLLIVVVERYSNRTDTKKIVETRKRGIQNKDGKSAGESFFSASQIFKKTTTMRSMTVRLKT